MKKFEIVAVIVVITGLVMDLSACGNKAYESFVVAEKSAEIVEEKTDRYSPAEYETEEFIIGTEKETTVLENSYDGQHIYYQEKIDFDTANIFKYNIEKGESELVIEKISSSSGMRIEDGYIVGWKPLDGNETTIFMYNVETKEMDTLPPYKKDTHQQINGFEDGKLLFRKIHSKSMTGKPWDRGESLHIYNTATKETKTLMVEDHVIASSSLRYEGKYVMYLRSSRFSDYPDEEIMKLEIYDTEADVWVDVEIDENLYEANPILSDEYIIWARNVVTNQEETDDTFSPVHTIKYKKLMAYHIPTKTEFQINEDGIDIRYVMSYENGNLFYFADVDENIDEDKSNLTKAMFSYDRELNLIERERIGNVWVSLGCILDTDDDWIVLWDAENFPSIYAYTTQKINLCTQLKPVKMI
jgi:hypothetical protein